MLSLSTFYIQRIELMLVGLVKKTTVEVYNKLRRSYFFLNYESCMILYSPFYDILWYYEHEDQIKKSAIDYTNTMLKYILIEPCFFFFWYTLDYICSFYFNNYYYWKTQQAVHLRRTLHSNMHWFTISYPANKKLCTWCNPNEFFYLKELNQFS